MQQDFSFARFLTRSQSCILDCRWHKGRITEIDVNLSLFPSEESFYNLMTLCNQRGIVLLAPEHKF